MKGGREGRKGGREEGRDGRRERGRDEDVNVMLQLTLGALQ